MASLNFFNSFSENTAEKVHNLGSDQLKVALTNTQPEATNTVYANLTSPLATTNLSGATPFNLTTSTSAQTSGNYKLVVDDLVLTATGEVGPFQYVVIYNDTATDDPLIGWYEDTAARTLQSGDTYTINLDGTNGLLAFTKA
jgi:hypothetical protein